MKILSHFFLALLLILSAAHSKEESSRSSRELGNPPTSARILGDIPDGTPSAPEPPKPEFVVPAKDILNSKTHQQGGRKIMVQRITPIVLPDPAKREPTITPDTPAIAERIKEFIEENPDAGFLFIGTRVYRALEGSQRTFVNLWPQGQGEAVSFWSSADFAMLSGFSSFIGSDGKSRKMIMAWDSQEIESLRELKDEEGIPPLPALAEGKASFSITSRKPTEEALAAIQSLHDLYNNEYTRLLTAYQAREEAELKANPPKAKDLVLNHWRIEGAAAKQKGATAR